MNWFSIEKKNNTNMKVLNFENFSLILCKAWCRPSLSWIYKVNFWSIIVKGCFKVLSLCQNISEKFHYWWTHKPSTKSMPSELVLEYWFSILPRSRSWNTSLILSSEVMVMRDPKRRRTIPTFRKFPLFVDNLKGIIKILKQIKRKHKNIGLSPYRIPHLITVIYGNAR